MALIAAPGAGSEVIRTPDQRLRVFVSSTLGELADERAAVREAIERLRLAPVMFELGARPHPPRALYRAYVQQSHIFIGVYWESYGWVAPEMAISGIEDEYEVAVGLPCLVYVKAPAPGRDPRLEEFLGRVRGDDRVSYKQFETADELAELVADDLALLLTERFEVGYGVISAGVRPRPLPLAPTRLVGRERDLEAICALVAREDVRLLTLSGVGGIGKTRLALAAAAELCGLFSGAVGFVDLSSVESPERVASAVAEALGVLREGRHPLEELLFERLAGVRMLLVLDNFEHVLAAAPFVAELLARCPEIKVIVTSRVLLRLRGERELDVQPLEVPAADAPAFPAEGGASAVQLFVERAQDHDPGFDVDAANAACVVELCRRLDGIPLAIELAAARVRVLPPAALLERIEDRLDLLTGPADLPPRQRTLRATIDWSYDLLGSAERELFAALSVCVGGFDLASAAAVCDPGMPDPLEGVSSLIEKSLIVPQKYVDAEPRFRMLETVREYAHERLVQSGGEQRARLRMGRYLTKLAAEAGEGLVTVEHRAWLARLDAEVDNLRATIKWAFEMGDFELFLRIGVPPWIYWWQRGHIPELHPLLERCLETYTPDDPEIRALQLWGVGAARPIVGKAEAALPLLRDVIHLQRSRGDAHGAAVAQWSYCSHSNWEKPPELRALLADAVDTLRRVGDEWVASFALTVLGEIHLLEGNLATAERLATEALERAEAIRSDSVRSVALIGLGYLALAQGDLALARVRFTECAHGFQRIQDREGVTYALDGLAAVALGEGSAKLAAEAIGAADSTRRKIGVGLYPMTQPFRVSLVSGAESALGRSALYTSRKAGEETGPDQMIEKLIGHRRQPSQPVAEA